MLTFILPIMAVRGILLDFTGLAPLWAVKDQGVT